ncbi:19263_t:CDS:2, partial [Gigaspora rosea]
MNEENSQDENSQDKNPQSRNSRSRDSQEPNSKKSAGQPPAEVWNFFDKGVSVKGYCSGQCKVYKDVIDFYTKVDASRQSHSQAVSRKIIPGTTLNKKKRTLTNSQTSLSEFVESTKLTSQSEDNINSALIKAFI